MTRENGNGRCWVALCGILVGAGWMLPAPAAAARHTAAECRAACQERNIPASCEWLSPLPRRCVGEAKRACETSKVPGPAQCLPPQDLPGCLSNHGCPYGSLCVDATCQVVACGGHNGIADCTGNNGCKHDKCVVAECNAATSNCPKGFHCEPADAPFSEISGTCVDDLKLSYCMADTDCIALGNFNPNCLQGVCTPQGRPLGRCETDADCPRWCRRGLHAQRLSRCDLAGMCVCPSATDVAQCDQLVDCPHGKAPALTKYGTCVCHKPRQSPSPSTTTTTTTITVTSTTETTDTLPPSTTTTTLNTVCCCNFEVGDSQWHCVHSQMPSPYLCAIPWPDCCSEAYTVCQ